MVCMDMLPILKYLGIHSMSHNCPLLLKTLHIFFVLSLTKTFIKRKGNYKEREKMNTKALHTVNPAHLRRPIWAQYLYLYFN